MQEYNTCCVKMYYRTQKEMGVCKKMSKSHSRYNVARKILIFWCLFIGIGAVAGSVGMLTAIDGSNLGMQTMLPYFQVLPFADLLFQNYLFPGIALLCVNGIPNLVTAYLLLKRKQVGNVCGMIFGITLMLWICIQFVIFPMNFMSTIYSIFGLLQCITGICAIIFYRQEHFVVNLEDYPNIGTNQEQLVVYFSRMGYTKKVAYEQANLTGAHLYEIHATERTEGTLGFWWCGRFGMHRWEMPIEPMNIDFEKYSKITICTPIWVFHICGPILSFCKYAKGKIQKAEYMLVHYQKSDYANEIDALDTLLDIHAEKATSICQRQGRIIHKHSIR